MVEREGNIANVVCASDEAKNVLFGAYGKNCAGECDGFKHLSKGSGGKFLTRCLCYMLRERVSLHYYH